MQLFNRPLKLVICDVDGVLVAHHPYLQRNMEHVAVQLGLPVEPLEIFFEQFLEGKEKGKFKFKEVIHYIWRNWGTISEEMARNFSEQLRIHEESHPYPAIPGAIETLQWLRAQGIALALSSNNKMNTLIPRIHLAGFDHSWFSYIATSDRGYHKPDRRMLDDVLQGLSILREHTVFVGDWYPDIICARAADVPFLAVLSGYVPKWCFLRENVSEEHIMENINELRQRITN